MATALRDRPAIDMPAASASPAGGAVLKLDLSFHRFSNSLVELYDAAERTMPDRFPEEVVRIIGKLIHFDGAVLATCASNAATRAGLHLEQAHVYNRSPAIIADYAEVAGLDPAGQSLAAGLSQPLAIDYAARCDETGHERLQAFAQKYGVRKLLFYGDKSSGDGRAQWLALIRAAGDGFSGADALILRNAWSHVKHAFHMNMRRALDHIDPHHQTRALAFINARGVLEMANPAMADLLKLEWPASHERHLPASAIGSLIQTGKYRGKRIELAATQKFGYMACSGRRIPAIDMLTPSELNVANCFAKGMTHSQVASHLNVSPHTVRNQLANVYQKLGIHSKVELVRAMSSRQRE